MLADGVRSEGRSPKRSRPSGGGSGYLLSGSQLSRVHVQIFAFRPLLLGHHQQRQGQPQTRAGGGKDSHHAGALFHLLILALGHVGRLDAPAMLLRRRFGRQRLLGMLFQSANYGWRLPRTAAPSHSAHRPPNTDMDCRGAQAAGQSRHPASRPAPRPDSFFLLNRIAARRWM